MAAAGAALASRRGGGGASVTRAQRRTHALLWPVLGLLLLAGLAAAVRARPAAAAPERIAASGVRP